MKIGVGARFRRIAKVLAALCTIELLVPGGTLIVLILVLTGGCHLGPPDEGERAAGIWRGVREQVFGNTADGGSRRTDENNALPGSSQSG